MFRESLTTKVDEAEFCAAIPTPEVANKKAPAMTAVKRVVALILERIDMVRKCQPATLFTKMLQALLAISLTYVGDSRFFMLKGKCWKSAMPQILQRFVATDL